MSRYPNYPPQPGDGADRDSSNDAGRGSGASPSGPDYLSGPGSPGRQPRPQRPPAPNPNYSPAWPPVAAPDPAFLGQPEALPPARGSGCGRTVMTIALVLGLLAVLVLVAGCGGYIAVAANLPSADQLATTNLTQSTKIYDRNGTILYEVFDPNSVNGGRRTVVPPEKIPNVLKLATIDTEDPTFYTNPGVDWYGIARAIYYDVRYQRVIAGGSTITQQLVRNTLITPEPTVQRKIREAVLAVEVTRRYSKDQILAMYLNAINYGNLSYGIQAASQGYFGKDVSQIDLAEASLLAGLPQAPAVYDPCVNADRALARQKAVLGLMQERGHITAQQVDAAESEMEQWLNSDAFDRQCKIRTAKLSAPHFVNYVLQQLEEQYGQEVVYNGGLQVYTTLDPTLQDIVQQEAQSQIAKLKGNNVKSAAVVATNPQTGEILAMIGSVDFYSKDIDGQVNVATSLRQPGSSIKPINYVTALQKGWTPATPILDLITPFPNGGQPPYVPTNYDGKEHGIVSVREALGNSLNIPAVKTLYFVGVKDMIATAQKMGITSFKDPSRYGLALTLGGGEVRLSELTNAYSVFADGGKLVPMTPYLKIVDGQGNTILDNTRNARQGQQVLDPRHAYLITSILSDNNARALEFGANSPLKTSRPTFAKTGTTNDFKDNWTLGGTTELVVGVWVGDPRNTAMKNVSGIAGAAPIWHNVLERAYKEDKLYSGIAPHDFPIPQGLVRATVCNESGLLPTDLCPANHRHTEVFLADQAPNKPDDVWVKLKIDKTNNLLANDKCPADQVEERVFEKMPKDPVLPYDQVVKWANGHGIPQPPTQESPCTNQPTPEPTSAANEVKINSPRDGDRVSGRLRVTGTAAIPDFDHFEVEIGQNNQWLAIGRGDNPVENGVLALLDTAQAPDGPYTIRLTAFDKSGGMQQDQVQVTVDNRRDTPTPPPTVTPTLSPTPPPVITPTPPPTGNGPGTYQDNNSAVSYSPGWQSRTSPQASGGTFHVSSQPGASATLEVVGAPSFTVALLGGPNRGVARVLVDGNQVGTINGASPDTKDIVGGPFSLGDTGPHTITIQVVGNKAVALDFIVVNGVMALAEPVPGSLGMSAVMEDRYNVILF